MSRRVKTAVLISGNGSNLQALIDAARAPDYPAEIGLVISNKTDAYGLERARKAGIPAIALSHRDYESRDAFDRAVHAELERAHIEIVCLAGFMRLLSRWFVEKWEGRLLNIHPSLLPAFKGADAIGDALNYGVKITGCTVHLVTEEVDAGPILAQAAVAVENGDTKETLAPRIHAQEHILYPQALATLASGLL